MKRMAIAFWKSERAERIEVALFDAAPKLRPPQAGFEWEEADPLTTFDLKRFNAVRGYQAQQGRELSRCLKELRLLRRDAARGMHGEPERASQNEPEHPPEPANDDARNLPTADDFAGSPNHLQNKPELRRPAATAATNFARTKCHVQAAPGIAAVRGRTDRRPQQYKRTEAPGSARRPGHRPRRVAQPPRAAPPGRSGAARGLACLDGIRGQA